MITSKEFFNDIQEKTTIRKREINEKSKQYFMKVLNKVNWNYLYPLTDSNLEQYLCTFNGLYNYSFPINKVCLKLKTFFNPWMNKGPNKLSKRKEKLYDKFLKSKTNKNEKKYKTCKTLFEMLREKSKKLYYSRKLDSCKQNMMKTSDRIKEVVGKTKTFENDVLKKIVIDELKLFIKMQLLMNSLNFVLKLSLNLHLQSQPLSKI